MAIVAIKESAWQIGTETQRSILKKATANLDLGIPVKYVAPDLEVWYVFHDTGISLLDVAYLGVLCVGLASLPPQMQPTRQDVVDYVTGRVVVPQDIPGLGQSSNPWQAVLDAQSAPAWVRAASEVPDTYTVSE